MHSMMVLSSGVGIFLCKCIRTLAQIWQWYSMQGLCTDPALNTIVIAGAPKCYLDMLYKLYK